MAETKGRALAAIFCDDIRIEQGNKFSLMGTYQGHMFVPEFPIMLPKLCAFLTLVTPYSAPFKSLVIRLLKDEEVIVEHKLEEGMLKRQEAFPITNVEVNVANQVSVMNFPVAMSPFPLDRQMLIRARAIADGGEEIRAPGLLIRQAGT